MARRRKSTDSTPTPGIPGTPGTSRIPESNSGLSGPSHAPTPGQALGATPDTQALPPRVLIVTTARVLRDLASAHLSDTCDRCDHALSAEQARVVLASCTNYDVVMIQATLPDTQALAAFIADRYPSLSIVLLGETPRLDDAVTALRCGAVDALSPRLTRDEFIDRVFTACAKSRRARGREERVERLRRLCRQLQTARQEMSRHIESLCTDLAGAYRDLNDRMNDVALATEFGGLIRRELDIESLLRTVLEFVLTKSGPTNAAIFLPASSGDFSLGAYVNYDGPKEAAEMLLDHLASSLAPRFEHDTDIRVLKGRQDIDAVLGDDADWIGDSSLVVVPCRHDNDCLAVMVLFRDQRQPFDDGLKPTLALIADLFGKQLARVIHVHHRHLPPSKWGDAWGPSRDSDDGLPDIDLAA